MLIEPVASDDHIQGQNNSAVTLVEYGDYQCPYCGQAYPIMKEIQKYFGSKLRFVFRNFPLTEIHPLAEPAAQAAEYASQLGRFWEMHDLIYENQHRFSPELFLELAGMLNLPQPQLKEALVNRAFEPKIRKDFLGGIRSGVNGTPTLFVNNNRYDGPVGFEPLVLAISEVVKKSA